MAKAAAYEDSEEEQKATGRKRAGEKEASDVEDDEQEEGEDEEAFEIEAILGHKKNVIKKGHTAYWVKWKGYEDTENSWVDEDDAEGAKEMIKEYWEGLKRANTDTSARKRTATSSAGRKSVAGRGESEGDMSTSVSKRGRGGRKPDVTTDDSEDDKPSQSKLDLSSKKGRGSPKTKKRKIDDMDTGEEAITPDSYFDFSERMKEDSWEHLVKTIDTVERSKDGLVVYFRTTDDKMVRQSSTVCAAKFPQKLIEFYENNLKWRDG
jgi:chromobox protein 5